MPLKRKHSIYHSMSNSHISEIKETEETERSKVSFFKQFIKLMKNVPFLLIMISNSFIFFILTGIQYWVTDYLINEIKQKEDVVLGTFGIVSITGPVFGVVIGGNVTSALGGFRSKKALMMTQLMSFLCVLSALPIPFIDNFWIFVILLWLLLFFGGYMMPSLSGIMLETIDADFKATGNSVANLAYNLVGFLPAPSVYGFVYDYGRGGNAR